MIAPAVLAPAGSANSIRISRGRTTIVRGPVNLVPAATPGIRRACRQDFKASSTTDAHAGRDCDRVGRRNALPSKRTSRTTEGPAVFPQRGPTGRSVCVHHRAGSEITRRVKATSVRFLDMELTEAERPSSYQEQRSGAPGSATAIGRHESTQRRPLGRATVSPSLIRNNLQRTPGTYPYSSGGLAPRSRGCR
jgi:hypothetical protein